MKIQDHPLARFSLGRVVITIEGKDQVSNEEIRIFLERHQLCQWSELSSREMEENNEAIRVNGVVTSIHRNAAGRRILVSSWLDENTTTILAPEE